MCEFAENSLTCGANYTSITTRAVDNSARRAKKSWAGRLASIFSADIHIEERASAAGGR